MGSRGVVRRKGNDDLRELCLGLGGARWAREVERGAVAVVDLEGVVGRGHHVEVEHKADLVLFGLVEGFHVEFGAEEAFFFSGPPWTELVGDSFQESRVCKMDLPAEADGVLHREVGELDGDLEQRDGAGAVVVDSRALGDGVGVAGDVDHVVLVATLGLSDDVVGGDVLGISGELCGDIASGSEQGHEALTRGLGDAAGWHIFVVCFRVALERVAEQVALDVVVDQDADGTLGCGELDLLAGDAGASGDERDRAAQISRKISLEAC